MQGSGVECVDDGINRKRVGLIRILTGIPKRKICNKFNQLGKKERHYNVGFSIFFYFDISLEAHLNIAVGAIYKATEPHIGSVNILFIRNLEKIYLPRARAPSQHKLRARGSIKVT